MGLVALLPNIRSTFLLWIGQFNKASFDPQSLTTPLHSSSNLLLRRHNHTITTRMAWLMPNNSFKPKPLRGSA